MGIEERLQRIERLLVISTKNVWSVKELALVIDRSESHIYTLCSLKKIPHYKQGTNTWFKKSEIEAWQCETRIPTEAEIESMAITHTATHRLKK